MTTNVEAPSAGESVTEIEVGKWNIADGDIVEKDQILAVAETEKATLEIRAPITGKVKILINEGVVVAPGDSIAVIDESVDLPSSTSPATSITQTSSITTPSEKPPASEISSPPHPPSTNRGTVVEDKIGKNSITSNETKTFTITPILSHKSVSPAPYKDTDTSTSIPVYASPSVRKMIVEHNVDTNQLLKSQTEDSSLITEKDVEKFLQSRVSTSSNQLFQSKSKELSVKELPFNRETSSRKMTRLRQTIAKRLVAAQQNAALLTTFNEVDMSEVMSIRKSYKELYKKKHDVGLGFMSFFVKAVCQSLVEFPIINSILDDNLIIEHHYADIGIAIATPKGLVVPVIRNAESLSFEKIEKIIVDFGKKGKEGSISIDDLVGGTFTITNGGTFGSMLSTPIVNPPQSAILGMHNIVEKPVVRDGEIVIRPIMYVALSYDHRLIDGADSVKFLYRIKELIEDPHRLLVGV